MNVTAAHLDDYDHHTDLTSRQQGQQQLLTGLNVLLANAIFFVVQHYFARDEASLVFTVCCGRHKYCALYNDVLEELFRTWNSSASVQIVAVAHAEQQRVPGMRKKNIILTDSYESFLRADVASHAADYNFNEFYFVVLRRSFGSKTWPQLQQIFEYCWAHHLLHCSVLVQTLHDDLVVYTYFPFTPERCGSTAPVPISRFNGSAFTGPHVFPDKLQNFQQCPLRAAVWNVMPYTLLTTNSDGSSIVGGIEGHMLLELARRLNFTLQLTELSYRARRMKNGSNIALRMLKNDVVDLSLGAFRQSVEADRVATPVNSYFQSKMVLVINPEAYELHSGEILVHPFRTSTWLLIIFAWALSVLQVAVASGVFRQRSSSYLDLFMVLVGMPAVRPPSRTSGRIFCINWLIFTLLIRTVYQAQLFRLISAHVTHALPKSFADLVAANTTVVVDVGTHALVNHVNDLHSVPHVILDATNEVAALQYIERTSATRAFAVGSRTFVQHYIKTNFKDDVFEVLPGYLFSIQYTTYLAKHSFLSDKFNDELKWFTAVGLIGLWSRTRVSRRKQQLSPKVNVLEGEDLYVVFVMHGTLLCLGILIFLLEVLVFKYRNRVGVA